MKQALAHASLSNWRSRFTVACCCGDNRRQSSWPRRVWTLDMTKPLLAWNSASLSILTPAPTFYTSTDFDFAEEYLCNGGWYLKKSNGSTKKHIKGNQLTWKNHKNSDQSEVLLRSVRGMVKTVKFRHPWSMQGMPGNDRSVLWISVIRSTCGNPRQIKATHKSLLVVFESPLHMSLFKISSTHLSVISFSVCVGTLCFISMRDQALDFPRPA